MIDHSFSHNWQMTKAVVRSKGGIVASQNRRAADAGAAILRAGGNAVDAAIAASFTVGVLENWMNGLGGGGCMLVYMAKEHPLRHLGGIGIGPAFRVVMQVMELADGGVAGLDHLDIELTGDGLDLAGRQLLHETIHHAAPGPEAVLAGGAALARTFGQARHGALKGMGMEIGHARQDGAGRAHRVTGGGLSAGVGGHRREAAIDRDLEQDVPRPAVRQERSFGKETMNDAHEGDRKCRVARPDVLPDRHGPGGAGARIPVL